MNIVDAGILLLLGLGAVTGFKNGFTAGQISQGLSHVIYFNR